MKYNISQMWYKKSPIHFPLLPFSWFYLLIISLRRFLYKKNILKSHRVKVPVIIIGNITVGGTGKTPLVIALTDLLKKNGFHPGIITRGYRGKSKTWPEIVTKNSNPIMVGDEPVLLAKNTNIPVVAGPNRIANCEKLLREFHCDIIISDDGLQHYALQRDIEIAVIDGTRRLGNEFCLPAGPLREPKNRLNAVDFVIVNGKTANPNEYPMHFELNEIINVCDENKKITFADCMNKKITVIAGIGNPTRFFDALRQKELTISTRIFPDHYTYSKKDFEKITDKMILMTEKDAVKCRRFCDERFWYVTGKTTLNSQIEQLILTSIFKN